MIPTFIIAIIAVAIPLIPSKPVIYTKLAEPAYIETMAEITAYSEIDSCHYENCVMANGKPAEVGYIACPREIALETKIEALGEVYICGDRTAKHYNGRYDIFKGYGKEAHKEALEFGRQYKIIKIIK